MKFLVLALCVCAASAASFEYKPYTPYQPNKGFRQPVVPPVVAAKAVYTDAKFYSTAAPVAVAKASYDDASPVVPEAVVVDAKALYNVPQRVDIAPVPAKEVYASAHVASTPVFAAKTVYEKPQVKNLYNPGNEAEASIVRSDSEVSAEGYNFAYETANGIAAQSSGTLKTVEDANVLVSQGSFQYYAPDGTLVKVDYVADENGFQPRSDLLPVGPPIPEQIARSLEYQRTHPQKPESY